MQGSNWGGFNWFTWMFIFFFASSIAGTGSLMLIEFFGFPILWSSFLMLPLLGLIFWLFYKRYSVKMWLLVACVGFILCSGIALLRGFTLEEPENPSYLPDDLQPAGGMSWLGLLTGDYGNYTDYYVERDNIYEVEGERTDFLVQNTYLPRTDITIYFPEFETLDGQWAFKEGFISISGAFTGSFRVDKTQNWISVDDMIFQAQSESTLRPIKPYLVVGIPLEDEYDEAIQVEATLVITYPLPTEDGFETIESQLTRTLNLYTPPADFYLAESKYSEYQRAKRVVHEFPTWIGLIAGSVLAGIGAVVLVQQGALRDHFSGGFIVQVRKLTGLQNLGVEAHKLNTLSNAVTQHATHGVFIGFVNAQSPAGRAGLRSGDILTEFAGKTIHTPNELNRAAGRLKRGEVAQVTVIREGQSITLFVKF